MTDNADRHVGLLLLEEYWKDNVAGIVNVPGDPKARWVVDPLHDTLAIRVPADNVLPDVTALANVDVDEILDDGTEWQQLRVHVDANLAEVYGVLCNVLDRVQLAGDRLADAVAAVLGSLREILTQRVGLPIEQQVGLFGELLVLQWVAAAFGAPEAMSAWRGPLGEEHDFGLGAGDVEVKTTLGENRWHWISRLTQLVPVPDRRLYLLSIQVTTAALNAGWTLPALVAAVRDLPDMPLAELQSALIRTRYRDSDADLYTRRWAVRGKPAFFLVDDDFPRLTPSLINEVVPQPDRVLEVRYQLNLASLEEAPPLFSCPTAVTTEGVT
jgi:hypothetical protein